MTVIDLPTLAKRVHGELFARGVEVVPPDVIITGASPLAVGVMARGNVSGCSRASTHCAVRAASTGTARNSSM